VVNSGLIRLQNGHQDTYEAGTQRERAYMRGLSTVYGPESIEDSATTIASMVARAVIEEVELN
jgi:hypothetical protein